MYERLGPFLTLDMARRNTQRSTASFGVDGKQFVHPRHNQNCNRASWVEPHRLEERSSGMRPTSDGATIRLWELEISRNFLKSVEWAASHPSYIQSAHALTIVPKEKR
jgi:hypothetical protein